MILYVGSWRSFLLLFLLLLCHLDEGVLQHGHTGYQACESFFLGEFFVVVGDALCDFVCHYGNFILGEGLFHSHYLLLSITDHSFLGFSQDLLEGLLFWRAGMRGEGIAHDVELRGNGESSCRFVFFDVGDQFASDECVFDELFPGACGGSGEGSLWPICF
jgi:hypothetical protein